MARACGLILLSAQLALWLSGAGSSDLHRGIGAAAGLLLAIAIGRAPPLARTPWAPLAVALAVGGGIAWFFRQVHAHSYFQYGNFDLGIYSNIALNTATGRPFFSSILVRNHLGEHFSPVIALFAPLYALQPSVRWLFAAQCLSFAAVPLILLRFVRRLEPDRARADLAALILTAAWMLYPPMQAAMAYPFHPTALAGPFAVLAFIRVHEGRFRAAFPFLLALLLCKENMSLVAVGLGLQALATHRARRPGLLLMAFGAAAGWLLVGFVIPAFREGTWQHAARLGPLVDVPQKAFYIMGLLLPLAFLPLFGWRGGVAALPLILLNVSTRFPPQYSSGFHYDDVIAPLLLAASAPVVIALVQRGAATRWAPAALAVAFAAGVCLVPASPLRAVLRQHPPPELIDVRQDLVRLERDHPQARIYAQSHLGPHLLRPDLRQIPLKTKDCGAEAYPAGSLVVLSEYVNPWGLRDYTACVESMERRPARFERVPGFRRLDVFRVLAPSP